MERLSRKEQIKVIAASLFRKRGYTATSMRDIATEIGMEAPSLYNHIKGKQQILSEIIMTVAHAFTRGMTEIRTSSISSIDQLERIVILHVDITIDHTDAVSMLTKEWVHLEGEVASEFSRLKADYEAQCREVLQACIDEGQLQPVHVDIALFSMLSTLRWLYSWYSYNRSVDRKELEDEMVKLLIPARAV